jgi:tetraacyldisaccharide 4'-kinase
MASALLKLAAAAAGSPFAAWATPRRVKGSGLSLDALKGKKITLVTGIANPAPLVEFLISEGITFEHLKYNDHHFFTDQEIKLLKEKECILTTEKDYVRLKSKITGLHYIEVKHEFFENDRELLKKELLQFMSTIS